MILPYDVELGYAALSILAQAKKHGEETFALRSQTLFERLRTILSGADLNVDELVTRLVSGDGIDAEKVVLDSLRVMDLEAAFRAVGLASSLPRKSGRVVR